MHIFDYPLCIVLSGYTLFYLRMSTCSTRAPSREVVSRSHCLGDVWACLFFHILSNWMVSFFLAHQMRVYLHILFAFLWLLGTKYCTANFVLNILVQNRKKEILFCPYLGLIHLLWIPCGPLPWGIRLWGWSGQDGDPAGRGVKLGSFKRTWALWEKDQKMGKRYRKKKQHKEIKTLKKSL